MLRHAEKRKCYAIKDGIKKKRENRLETAVRVRVCASKASILASLDNAHFRDTSASSNDLLV